MDPKSIRKCVRELGVAASGKKVVCLVDYQQFSDADEPHLLTTVATLVVNETTVGEIVFTGEPGEPKEKSIRVDITPYLTESFNVVQLTVLTDRDFVQEGFHSEADFRLRVGGDEKVKLHYETRLPLRQSQDLWVLEGV